MCCVYKISKITVTSSVYNIKSFDHVDMEWWTLLILQAPGQGSQAPGSMPQPTPQMTQMRAPGNMPNPMTQGKEICRVWIRPATHGLKQSLLLKFFKLYTHACTIVMCKADPGIDSIGHTPLVVAHFAQVVCVLKNRFWKKQLVPLEFYQLQLKERMAFAVPMRPISVFS